MLIWVGVCSAFWAVMRVTRDKKYLLCSCALALHYLLTKAVLTQERKKC